MPGAAAQSVYKPNILIVDDDPLSLQGVASALAGRYEVTMMSDPDLGHCFAVSSQPALVILDIDLGGRSGLCLCRALREDPQTRNIPVMMLSGYDDFESRELAFGAGADDYVEKPAVPQDLILRVESKLRRWRELAVVRSGGSRETIHCGSLVLFPHRNEALIAGRAIPLSVLEFRLLREFVEKREKIVSRDDLLKSVWPGVRVGARTVDSHLVNIRRHLLRSEFELANVYGAGFMLRRRDGA